MKVFFALLLIVAFACVCEAWVRPGDVEKGSKAYKAMKNVDMAKMRSNWRFVKAAFLLKVT